MLAAVVSARSKSNHITFCDLRETTDHRLMRANYLREAIQLQELNHTIWPILHYIFNTFRVSLCMWLHSWNRVIWIRPQQINHHLLFRSGHLLWNLERTLQMVDLIELVNRAADPRMSTEDLIPNNPRHWQQLEEFINCSVDLRHLLARNLVQSTVTFVQEAIGLVNQSVLMGASQ